ncbi:GerAB/ArcD/ProY family transporter [Piscibacillus halophilus]|uniref:Spore germination protein (Amino acid permease) n=1 Tax=Piscibacillus halophilus TaxID=571933 RepID=A0A1H9G479_9BACI|nr:GerAB/ArcD/ProY family transporter [Piscibacillus halophilus]SEQ44956.1 spore germination protein (amino acid permease) [Piscibacillus halophilus]
MKVKSRISSENLFFVLVQTMMGVGLLTLPHQTHHAAGSDGWISILITGFFIQLIVLLIWLLCIKFPNLTLFDFSKVILGKMLGTVLNFIYIIYLLTMICYIFIVYADILKRWILPETPVWVLFLIEFVLLIYGSICKIKNMISLLSFPFIFILFLFFITFFVYGDSSIDVRYLFPIGSSGGWNILKSTSDSMIPFIGFETLLIYFAFIKQSKTISALKGVFLAVLFVTIFLTYIVILSTVMLSPEEIKITPEPVLYILSAMEIRILSRLDLIFLSFWGLIVFTTIISYSFSVSMGISKLIRIKHNFAVILSGTFVLIVSIIFYYMEITLLEKWLKHLSLIFGIIIPILLLLITIIFKREAASTYEKN